MESVRGRTDTTLSLDVYFSAAVLSKRLSNCPPVVGACLTAWV